LKARSFLRAGLVHKHYSDSFRRREAATRELEKLGPEAGPALRHALAGSPSAEARRRLELLLAKAQGLRPAESLRVLRTIETLERIGSAEARRVLEAVAARAQADWLTWEAKASLARLAGQRLGAAKLTA
jgi:hypothetical protein